MKNLFLLIVVFVTGSWQLQGHENIQYQNQSKGFTVTAVHLITEREVEIVCPAQPANAQEVYDNFVVTVSGEKVDYTYLSYFDFGSYRDAPVINIRLAEPLDVGTLRGKTGNARTPGENTQAVNGPLAASTLQVRTGNQTVTARWAPFYDYMNIGSKSKLSATGTASCGTLAGNDVHLGIAYTNEHVIDYAAGGIHRMTGRAEMITQNAVDYGVTIMIVGADQSVYEAPQWRELYNPADYKTRRIIEGTLEKPIIVVTADDVMRQQSAGNMDRPQSDFFYLGEAFARMFWRVGVDGSANGATSGCRRIPRSVYNDPDDYRYDKHIAAAYEEAKKNNRYPGSRMMENLENYFVYGTMIFYEMLPESANGRWTHEGGPVNTREELKRYDNALYRPLCGIYGEWEYFSSENSDGFDRGRDGVRSSMPWFWHTQTDNFDITAQPYPALDIEHVRVIAENQIEIKFNREVKDMSALYNINNWKVQHSANGGQTWSDVSGVSMAGGYLWRSVTLQIDTSGDNVSNVGTFTLGSFGRSFRGFTQEDIDERKVSTGGWIADDQLPNPAALKMGQYVDMDEAISEYGAAMNGMFRIQYLGDSPVRDWAGNQLTVTKTYVADFMPWVGSVYRSPLTGVYIYGDVGVPKDVLILSGMYYDLGFTNNLYKEYTEWPSGIPYTLEELKTSSIFDRPGQRIADYAVKQSGGMLVVAEGQHPNQQPERRGQQAGNYHSGLYVEGWGGNIFQDQANNITRDYSMTRYKNEFLLYHEGGHGIDSYSGTNSYAPWVYTNINSAHNTARSEENGRRYYDENNVGAYLASRGEYVSTGSTYWHGTMRESKDGANDGTWTPVSNRWELYRYDPWGFEAFKRLFFSGDLGLWYENKVGDPSYRVLPGDWKYLQNDEELNRYLTLKSGLYGKGETVKIDSENALIAWGCTVFETLRDDPYNNYHNRDVNWLSWSTPSTYDITRKVSANPEFPNNNYGFLGGVLYYPEAKEPQSFLNPFLQQGGVKKPVRTSEDEALLNPVSGIADNLTFKTPALPVFEFSKAANITVDNAQTSFSVKVNGKKLGFRYFENDNMTVTLYLNWPLNEDDTLEITVLATGQTISNVWKTDRIQKIGLTRKELDALAIDPQSWDLQENMTWADWTPNPVINYEDPKDNKIVSKRTIKGMVILADFPDQPMISGEPAGSELMGNPLISEPDKSKLGQYWVNFLNKPGKDNNFVTLNGYFLENSYGDWEIELDACGPYTLSRFEFQYGLGYASGNTVSYQRFSDWFARGSANAEAYNLAKADSIQFFVPNADGTDRDPVYDFVFVLHAGYDQSGSWQELGEMMFQDEKSIHTVPTDNVKHSVTGRILPGVSGYDFSGEARIDRILAMVNTQGFDIKKAWPNFYLFSDTTTQNAEFAKMKEANPALTRATFDAKYPDMVQDILLAKLAAAKTEARNHPENPHYASAKTRYIPWSTWYGALGIWSGAGSATDSLAGYPVKRIPLSIQGESDGMGTFAHEFGHLMSLPDNYNNPYDIPRTRAYTGPYELMSRGSFGGPGGNHLRYQIPSTMGSSCPPNQVLRSKIGQGYTTSDEIVDVTYASIKNAPLIANVAARNIPTDKGVLDKAGKPITGNRGIRITDMVDATPKDNNTFGLYTAQTDSLRIDPGKWNWGRNVNYTGYTIEVLERTGYDSFINDHGVMIAKTADSGPTTIFVQDAHPTPLDLIDFVAPNGETAMISEGDQLQLASALYHAGVHNNPTYFKESYPEKFRPDDTRTGLHGNVVNEYIDSFNELHFYVLEKMTNEGKYGDYLSYRIAVRSTASDAAIVGGKLSLKAGKFEPASGGRFAVQHFTLTQAKNADNTDIVRISLLGASADDATVLNNVFAISPGEEINFSVYIKASGGTLDKFPINELLVKASSETNRGNETSYGKATIKTHTITFLPNSGKGVMSPEKVYEGENYVIKRNNFIHEGYTFARWNTAANGYGTAYVPGVAIPKVTSDITLYAQWVVSRYSITYNSNGGAGRMAIDNDVEHNTRYTIKDNTFTRDGHIFTGWNTAADGSGTAYPAGGSFVVTETVTLYAQWAVHVSDADIVRQFVVDDIHAGEFCSENAVTTREFMPNSIITNGVVDPFFAKGGTQFFPTDRPTGKAKIYVIAVDFSDLKGEVGVSYGLQRNIFRNQGSVYDLSDPQVIYESTFFGSNGFAGSSAYKYFGANGLKNMYPGKFLWDTADPAHDFKGLVQIINEISLGKMEIEVECLNLRLAELQGFDPKTDKWPWFHIDGPMIGYAVQGPADCEDYRQFARLHQAAINAAYRDIPGLNIEDIDLIYTVVPINAFGHRAGLQGGGGFDTSFSYNDQALLQRESEFRHEPGVKTKEGRIVGSGVFGIKNLWPGGNPRNAVNISIHEFLHGMGMIDDYYYGWMPYNNGESVNAAYYYGNTGESSVGQKFGSDSQDLTAWRKFRTGWLNDDEVKVILPGEKVTLNVRALSSYANDGGDYTDDPNIKTRMVVIPKEWRTRDSFGFLWGNGWNPKKDDYNWYDWFTNPWVGGETRAIKSFPTFYVLESRKKMGADNTMNADNQGVVINMIANPTWETGNGNGGFKLCTGSTGLKEEAVWTDPNLGLTVRILESNAYYDKVEIEYTGIATTTVNEAFPGPARHIYQGMLTASDNYVQPNDAFTVDFDIFTLGVSAVNDIQSPATAPPALQSENANFSNPAPFNNGVIRVATPLGVPGGIAGFEMKVEFDAANFDYISAGTAPFSYIVNTDSAASGVLYISAAGAKMIDKNTILRLNFKAKTNAITADYNIKGTLTDVTLLNWRGEKLKKGYPGFDDTGTIKDSQGNISLDPLKDLYKSYIENIVSYNVSGDSRDNNVIHYYDYTNYEPAIFSVGGKVHVSKEATYTVSGQITCDTPGPATGSFIGVESEVTLFNKVGNVVATTKSDWDGYYSIPGVPVGENYYITAGKPKYFDGESVPFAVSHANVTAETLQLQRLTYKVSGVVYGGEKSDGSDATPLPGVDVYILNIGNAYKVLGGPYKTDTQGRYVIDARVETWNKPFAAVAVDVMNTGFGYQVQVKDVTAGVLHLNLGGLYGIDPNDRIYPDNSITYGTGGGYNFLLASDVTDRNIVLTKLQEVHLRTGTKSTEIFYQLKTMDGNPVGNPLQSVGTGNGDDILRNVPAGGPYYIEVSRPGYLSACTMPFSVGTTRIFLRNAFSTNTLDLVKKDGAEMISGTVIDAKAGKPLDEVEIVLVPYANNRGKGVPIYSDKNGQFSYPDTTGEKDFIFSKKGYHDYTLNLRDGAPAKLEVTLKPK